MASSDVPMMALTLVCVNDGVQGNNTRSARGSAGMVIDRPRVAHVTKALSDGLWASMRRKQTSVDSSADTSRRRIRSDTCFTVSVARSPA